MSSLPLLGGVELGGTKCICLIGTGPDDVRSRISIPTGLDADETLAGIEAALRAGIADHGPIAALGIASFGPIDLDTGSKRYGWITSTTKPGWRDVPVSTRLARAFPVPVGFDTDVNGAALAEGRWGAARGLDDFAYITVGTGVGVGLVIGGRPARGFSHSELGHIRIGRHPGDDWPGACAFHGDCVEGLASGSAIFARAGIAAPDVPADSVVWTLVAHALAQLLHTLVLATAPRRIMLGGGVMQGRPELLAALRERLIGSLNGYIDLQGMAGDIEDYLVVPGLGASAGPLGALALAVDML